MHTVPASSSPRVAILVPIYRHPALVIEAIESVLEQRFADGLRLLLVNDGCPFPETDEVCQDYHLAYPDLVTYLRKTNGGLSEARNCGIRHVLAHLPSVEAIYMLDADNRLHPDAMSRAMAALDAHPDVDWIYPNIDMFGLEWKGDYGGAYSLLIHSRMNICEAGSLLRRRVFEAGVFFDTSFKMGWEDWDFFLSAARRGFRGLNIEDFGFLYRKRPESMLADSDRDHGALHGAMQQKHKALFAPRALAAREQDEAPRYAIHVVDRGEVICCTDPMAPGAHRLRFEAFDQEYWRAQIDPGRYRTPPFNVVLTEAVLTGLQRAGLLHWAFWKLESICEKSAIGALTARPGEQSRLSVSATTDAGARGLHRQAVAMMIPAGLLGDILRDARTEWVDSLAGEVATPPITAIDLCVSSSSNLLRELQQASAVFDTLSIVHRMRSSRWRPAAMRSWGHREAGISFRGREHTIVRRRIGDAPAFPRLADHRRHIGFLLPLVEFGGVEKVALQMARGLRAHGWVPHAFVLESADVALTADWAAVFESTNLLADSSFSTWGSGKQEYLGTNVPHWAQSGRHGDVLGLLHWLDAVMNFHGGAAVGVMGELRRMGILTLDSLHLNDVTALGRPVGNTYLGLAYEHAFDYFVPCSHRLGDWLHGMGVPRDKIVTVQNAPGFEIEPHITERGIAARHARHPADPLRVLYLGRLDRQKGLDRLTEVIRRSSSEKLNLIWRAIGKPVVTTDASSIPPEVSAMLEPPLSRASELAAVYAWADIVVLLSRYEGLPLTVLEAMRAGAVVVATDVGATGEVLVDGINGILIPDDSAVQKTLDILRKFCSDREYLMTLSAQAITDRMNYDWETATADLVIAMESGLSRIQKIAA